MFNHCADEMIVDLELQCNIAPHPTWKVLGHYLNLYVNKIFAEHGQDDLASVRERLHVRFDLLWDAFTQAYLNQCSQRGRLEPSASAAGRFEPPAKHYAKSKADKPITQVSLSASSCDPILTHPSTIPGVTVIEHTELGKKYPSAPWHQTRRKSVPSSFAVASYYSSAPPETALIVSRKRKQEPGHTTTPTALQSQWMANP